MSHQPFNSRFEALQLEGATARWDGEGGAGPRGPQTEPSVVDDLLDARERGRVTPNALHIRVIALENLVVALLATASDREIGLARNMAPFISPRQGSTPHPLTTKAAALMIDLVQRAARFRMKNHPEKAEEPQVQNAPVVLADHSTMKA